MKKFLKNIWLGVLTFIPLLLIALLIVTTFAFTAKAEEPTVAPAPGVQTVAEYQVYLNEHYGTITTNLKTVNVKDYIRVIENTDMFKTYDIAVVIDYDVIVPDTHDVIGSINYTEQQQLEFKESFKAYQKTISELTAATFPNKKLRGGFISSGYRYPNIKKGYYERSWYGWKNYSYGSDILNYYSDTTIGQLSWHDFGAAGAPLDNL